MNKVVTGIVMGRQLTCWRARSPAAAAAASSGDSTTVTVAGDVPIAYAQARQHDRASNPTDGAP